ncbi:MAG: hypothetical protein JSS81_18005 [Acidobacteria bacterium]|nr:hypothetical protein [Acidobacteriota bacterium]
MIKRIFFVLFILGAFYQTTAAQRQSLLVAPAATDPNITINLNNHYVSINRTAAPKNRLFVFLPGTGGVAVNYLEVNQTAADLGFHAVNLTYPNDDAVNTLCGAPNVDLDCYAKVRLETLDGVDRTPLVTVSRANSIENRLIKLLIYLRNQFPADNWGQFLIDDATPDWSKIVVAGHSQGGGHAGIIGRYHAVARVVMFAAMDFNGLANSPANWIAHPETTPNATPPERFRGFCHQRDEQVNFTLLTTRIWPAYGMPAAGAVVNVDTTAPPYNDTHSLTSNIECDNFHGCIAADARLVRVDGVPVYKPVWEYLLSNIVSPLSVGTVRFLRFGTMIDRPPVGASAKSYQLLATGAGFDATARAAINGVDVATEFVDAATLRVRLPAGRIGAAGRSTLQIRNQTGAVSNVLTF